MEVKIIAMTQFYLGDLENLCEYAGRVCTNTTDKTGNNTRNFLRTRIGQGHESILEHASVTFEISGISRACLAQLTRYRIASFSVESQRYVKYCNDDFGNDFVFPYSANDEQEQIAAGVYNVAFTAYEALIATGMNPEDARMVLPMAKTTRLVMTMNFRELRHFFKERLDKSAQQEIRALAEKMLKLLLPLAPTVFGQFAS